MKALEGRQIATETLLRQQIKPVETAPVGRENEPHNTNTTLSENNINYTVIASEESSRAERTGPNEAPPPKRQEPSAPYYRVTATQLLELAPRLGRYVPPHSRDFSFDAIVTAAYWLAGEMGVSTTLWARACQVMGRETAAVTLAIVSTRPAGHFTGSTALAVTLPVCCGNSRKANCTLSARYGSSRIRNGARTASIRRNTSPLADAPQVRKLQKRNTGGVSALPFHDISTVSTVSGRAYLHK